MPTVESQVDAMVEKLAKLPAPERRQAFLDAVAALPLNSRERLDLVRWRVQFCPGPYMAPEFDVISGLVEPRRRLTADETKRTADHADAMAILAQRRAEWLLTHAARERARAKLNRYNAYNAAGGQYEMDRILLGDASDAEKAAREAFEEAEQMEVKLRYHQPERVLAAGRNWLRFLRRGAQ